MSLAATGQYSSLLLDYIAERPSLCSFYEQRPTLEGLSAQIQTKQAFSSEQRKRLQRVLRRQYALFPPHKAVLENIDVLSKENTFVITTGQQLNLCLGPLYTDL